jgi:colicin import membrane protein
VTPRSPGAFILSATFHAIVIGAACLFTLDSCQDKATPHVLELVAGEGDNYGATEAPKLGTPGGVKVDIPTPPEPKLPEPKAPEPKVEPTPPPPEPKSEPPPVVTPAPTPKPTPKPPPKTPPKKDPDAIPNFSKQITRRVIRADSQAKREIKKEREAEAKRLAKEEYDRRQREKLASAKGSRVQHIDTEGIVNGVVGGSENNKVGGAGGKALQRDEASVMDAYDSLLQQRVKAAIDKPPGVSDNLTVTISFTISASGRISNVRVETSSGSQLWDDAVVAAFHRVTMPPHPLHHSEDLELSFRTNDATGG